MSYSWHPALSMPDFITVSIEDPPKSRFRELEHFLGARLYRKGSLWFINYPDRTEADLVVANLNAAGYHAHILHDVEQ